MKSTDSVDYSNNEELVTRESIENSPFTIIGMDGKYFGCVGQFRITEPNESKEVIEKELNEITWNRIVQIILILIQTEVKK